MGGTEEGFFTNIRGKTFDSDFYFPRGPPLPCQGNNAVFLDGVLGISALDFQMKGSPRIYFLWLNSNGGEEKKEVGRTDIPGTANFDESFSNGGAKPLCLCPLSLEHCALGY